MPGNPSGAVYSEAQLQTLGAVLARHPQVMVLSDEIYEHILFDGRKLRLVSAKACPELKDRSLIVNGVSKAYAMTGWRVGYAAGPAPLDKGDVNRAEPVLHLGLLARAGGGARSADRTAGLCSRVPRGFRAAPRSRGERHRPDSGPDARRSGGGILRLYRLRDPDRQRTPAGTVLEDDSAVAQYLLSEGRVAAVPGAAYGLSPFFRISTATSDVMLSDAVARIGAAVVKLQPGQVAA